jgi:hypothetical protein
LRRAILIIPRKKRDLVRHLAMACERAKMPEIKVFSMDFAI